MFGADGLYEVGETGTDFRGFGIGKCVEHECIGFGIGEHTCVALL